MAVDPPSSAPAGSSSSPSSSSSSSPSSASQSPMVPSPASQPPASRVPGLPMPSLNPLPLSASQEAQVRDLYYERVRKQCHAEIKAFADCALGRTFSVVFKCRDKNNEMNACLKSHATPRALDEAREEWFARRAERAAERAHKAARKAEQEKLLREWWGLEDQDGKPGSREDIQAKRRRFEESRRNRPERIGGMPAKDRPRFDDVPVVPESDEKR
ncbi:hypothetical protein SCUCBS95973_002039 [Sporothrix curviconia]|uniref:COX assembly mitochondrial protein n=1 Tax=Sporothrix curviconia TaxID=1260050 RepID=A0ABP0B4G9_9PEZI